MTSPVGPPRRDWGWAWWERAFLGLAGVGSAIVALWLTFVMLLVFGLTLHCAGPNGRDAAAGVALGAGWTVGAGVCSLTAVSLLRVSASLRGLTTGSWLAVLAAMFGLAMTFVGVSLVRQPPPSSTCVEIDVYD